MNKADAPCRPAASLKFTIDNILNLKTSGRGCDSCHPTGLRDDSAKDGLQSQHGERVGPERQERCPRHGEGGKVTPLWPQLRTDRACNEHETFSVVAHSRGVRHLSFRWQTWAQRATEQRPRSSVAERPRERRRCASRAATAAAKTAAPLRQPRTPTNLAPPPRKTK